MLRPIHLLRLMIAALLLALASCGGDSSTAGGVGSGGTGASIGTVQVAVTDAPAPEFNHVWVTITKVRFNTSRTAGPDDTGWLDYPLPAPVTVDLAALNNGALSAIFSNDSLTLPVGTYQQIRLVLVGDEDTLSNSATTTMDSNGAALAYNDQVETTVSSAATEYRLEIPSPAQGISVAGTFNVVASTPLRLALDFDIGDDVVKFLRNTVTGYTLKPRLGSLDIDHAATITGQIDLTSVNTAGADNLVIKAEILDSQTGQYDEVRATSPTATGSFTLYPVPIPQTLSATTADVVIRGRHMATMIIKGVPLTLGGTTALTTITPISVVASNEYTANFAAGALNPAGAWVEFYQTPGSGELPHEVDFRHASPFSGNLTDDIPMASADLQVATYSASAGLTFADTVPVEGSGSFQIYADAPGFAHTTAGVVAPPTGSTTSPVIMGFATALQAAPGSADTISGSITQSAISGKYPYDSGYLVITRNGLIATTLNLGNTLAQASGAGGAYTITNVAGSTPDAVYYGYVIVWNSAHPLASLSIQSVPGLASLRLGSATGFSITLD